MHSVWLVIDALCTPPTVEALSRVSRLVFPPVSNRTRVPINPKYVLVSMGRVSTFEEDSTTKSQLSAFAQVVTQSPAISSDENPLFEVQTVWPFSYEKV